MPINKDKQVSASVILDKKIYDEFKKICSIEKRSVSSQISLLIENFIKNYNI